MQVKLDDEVLFEIDDRMMKLLAHDLMDPLEEVKRRLRWIIEHKCDRSFSRLSEEWTKMDESGQSKLARLGVQSMPMNKRDLADLILSHPEYKNRAQRENSQKTKED